MSVIPDASNDTPAIRDARREVEMYTECFFILGELGVKGKEAIKAVNMLNFIDDKIKRATDTLNSLLASQLTGKDVKMEGSVLSMAEAKH